MLRRIEREVPLFEQLGIFTEAPKKKRKPRVVSVRPLRTDYTDMIDPDESYDVDDDETPMDDYSDYAISVDDIDVSDVDQIPEEPVEGEEDPETIDVSDVTDDDLVDTGDNNPPEDDSVPTEDNPSEEEPVEGSDVDTTQVDTATDTQPVSDTNAETPLTEDDPQPEDSPEENVDTQSPDGATDDGTNTGDGEVPVDDGTQDSGEGEVIDVGGAEPTDDFTAEVEPAPADGSDPNTTTDLSGDPNATSGDPNAQQQDQPYTKDDMRKFELFNKFMELQTAILYFIEKLDKIVTDDKKFSFAVKKSNRTFRELEDLLRDYMVLKFQSDSFLQNSFFYEKIRANAMLAIELLNINKIKIDED